MVKRRAPGGTFFYFMNTSIFITTELINVHKRYKIYISDNALYIFLILSCSGLAPKRPTSTTIAHFSTACTLSHKHFHTFTFTLSLLTNTFTLSHFHTFVVISKSPNIKQIHHLQWFSLKILPYTWCLPLHISRFNTLLARADDYQKIAPSHLLFSLKDTKFQRTREDDFENQPEK